MTADDLPKITRGVRLKRALAAAAVLLSAASGVVGAGAARAAALATYSPVPASQYAVVGASSTPKRVILDAHTGAILSMTVLPKASARP